LFLDIEKSCSKCKEYLREEEIFTGFQKNLSNYTVKCPICKECFVPKFTIYSEQENSYTKGRKGQTISLLPPVTLYKEFFNIITKKGDQIVMSESFIVDHHLVFWNTVLYFKVLKLPIFMLDLDYTPYH
jgi:NAD-dependent SIR2 family protein deacetylase